MLVLYHHPFLPSCRFARLMLAEYDVPHDLVREPFWEQRPAFLALNPAGTVPLAQESDGTLVCGAGVLMEYLEETRGAERGARRLMPEAPAPRAEMRRLVEWFMGKFHEEVAGPFVTERLLKVEIPGRFGGGAPDSTALRVARQNVRAHLAYLGHLIAERDWLAGHRLSFADLAAAAALSCVDYLGEVPWDEDEGVKDWYQRLKSRPSFRQFLAETARLVRPAAHYADLDF